MISKVTSLYDYKSIPLSEKQLTICVSEEEIRKELERLSRKYAVLQPCTEIGKGDVAVCALISSVPKFNRESIQFVAGKYLFDKTIEDSVVGMKPGESKTVDAAGVKVDIKVRNALRNMPAPIDDVLIQKANVEGVSTVDEYCAHYKSSKLEGRRSEAMAFLAVTIRDELVKRSQFAIDEEEKDRFVKNLVKMMIAQHEEDEPLPESGSQKERELLESFEARAVDAYLIYLVSEQFAFENNVSCSDEDYQEHLKHLAADWEMPIEDVREIEPFESYKTKKCNISILNILMAYIGENLKEQ